MINQRYNITDKYKETKIAYQNATTNKIFNQKFSSNSPIKDKHAKKNSNIAIITKKD